MPKDIDEKHDPMDQNAEESSLEIEEIQEVTETEEQRSPEERAINTDTAVAEEATAQDKADTIEVEVERKHKNRESTAEKAKRAAEEREAKGKSAEPVSKKVLDPLRLRGKKYRAAVKGLDRSMEYGAEEAIAIIRKAAYATFDASVDMHCTVKTEAVRGTLSLPHGNGKTKRVAVADDATLEAISNGKLDFDVLLATPAQMPKLAKHAKVLGPKGLMPSPKSGTVTDDVDKVKAEISKGRIEYRADKTGVVHVSIGRLSFTDTQLLENFQAMENALAASKIKSMSLAATMSPAVRVRLTK